MLQEEKNYKSLYEEEDWPYPGDVEARVAFSKRLRSLNVDLDHKPGETDRERFRAEQGAAVLRREMARKMVEVGMFPSIEAALNSPPPGPVYLPTQ
jgi:hypothetical protein